MELSVKERLVLSTILREKQVSDVVTIKIIRKLREELSFSEEEVKSLDIQVEEESGFVKWDDKAEKPKDVEIGEVATQIIKRMLQRLNKEGRIHEDWLEVYEKFVGSE
jgi:hypothetical protein